LTDRERFMDGDDLAAMEHQIRRVRRDRGCCGATRCGRRCSLSLRGRRRR
jgi:hypothetical protein